MNLKKSYGLLLILLVTAVFGVSCANNASAQNCESLDGAHKVDNEIDGYCFSYPEGFESTQLTDGLVTIASTMPESVSIDQAAAVGGQSVSVELTVVNLGEVNGRTAGDLAQERFAQFAASDFEMEWGTVLLDSEEAITIESQPGLLLTRKAFVVANGVGYEITLSPLNESMPEMAAEAEALWQEVVQNFSFYAN
jgi:hypothetical protein